MARCRIPRGHCRPLLLLPMVLMILRLRLQLRADPTGPPAATPGPPSPAAAAPPTLPPAAPCLPNATAAGLPGFSALPERMRDFLLFRHCRAFPLLHDAPAACRGPAGVFLLLAVKSSPSHYERRQLVRGTWGQRRRYAGAPVARLFLLGNPPPSEEAANLERLVALEARDHGDVLQWGFRDTFVNLSLKHTLFLDWQAARCPGARFVLSADDDVFVHTANVVRYLRDQPPDRHLFVGQPMVGSPPVRHPASKYFVPEILFPGDFYPPYCSGGGFLLSAFTVRAFWQAARSVPPFPIDDAFVGMCLERAGLAPSGHEGIRPFGLDQLGAPGRRSFDPCLYREVLLVHRFRPYEMLLMWEAVHDPHLRCYKRQRVPQKDSGLRPQ
uniref:Hexosyltransferase n=2 Tax=Ornithorhynchus anatinus TaxID=9258 RepID=A0A6I8N6P3_ORNAN